VGRSWAVLADGPKGNWKAAGPKDFGLAKKNRNCFGNSFKQT
jgi:hypothetical protein